MAVVRDVFDDGEPWPTEGAIYKWVLVSKVFRRNKFREALITGGYIGRNEDKFVLGPFTFSNFEGGIPNRFEIGHVQRLDPG
jgi:hypothetical protein